MNERFGKLEAETEVVKKVNTLLKNEVAANSKAEKARFVELEREAHRTAEYVNYESIEISSIPLPICDDELYDTIMKIIDELDVCEDISDMDIAACHRRQGKYTRKQVLVKFTWRGHARQILNARKNVSNIDWSTIDSRLPSTIYINESLSPYYKKLRYIAKNLWSEKQLYKYWVAGHKVNVIIKEGDEAVKVSHMSDFAKHIPGTDVTRFFK